MLEAAWEVHATTLANARDTPELIKAIQHIVETLHIDTNRLARVIYGRDTRPTGEVLVAALRDGMKALGAESRDAGITTTPIVHYLVRAVNTKGSKSSYGEDNEHGYYTKMTDAFKKLVVSFAPLYAQF